MKEYLYTSQGVNYPKTDTLIRSAVFFCASITLETLILKQTIEQKERRIVKCVYIFIQERHYVNTLVDVTFIICFLC